MPEGLIAEQIQALKSSIRSILGTAGRPAGSVQFILVSKTVGPERIQEAYQAGVRDFGENRVQEFLEKKDKLPADIRWHFIGRLQTNKVKSLLSCVPLPLIHSLDRRDLADELIRQAEKLSIPKVPCLIQINSSGESTKAGFAPEEVLPFVESIQSPVLDFRGLMTVGPLTEDPGLIRQAFRLVKNKQRELQKIFSGRSWDILSMGMSSDYEIAIEEGANLLRIGSAVFGKRQG